MADDDQPKAPRAGRRAAAGRRATAQDESGQDAPPDDLRASRPARSAMDEPSGGQPADAGNDSPTGPPAPRRGGGFMDSSGGGAGGGGGFMDGASGGTSSFKAPAAARGQPPADPLAEDGGNRKFMGISRRKAEQATKVEEEKAVRNRRYDDLAVDGIMEIPELEEEGKEDLSTVVAVAPKVRTNRVQGISELEEDMQFRLPTTDDRDIDLSVLTTVLCSSDQVDEGDDVWEPDILFTDVASELNREKEKAEGLTGEDGISLEQDNGDGLLGQMGGGGGMN